MKNKYILLLLCAALTVTIIGCQNPKTSPPEATAAPSQASDTTDAATKDSDLKNEENGAKQENNDSADDSSSKDDENSQNGETSPVPMEEQIVLEQDGIIVKAVSWDPDNAALEISAENTKDEDCIIQFTNTSVNNYMMDPIFSLNVASHSQASGTADFVPGFLEECGIQNVAQIETKLLLLDALSFETQYTSDLLTISTGGSLEQQTYDDSGEVIYDQSGLKLVSKGIQENPVFGKQWKLYIANDTGEDLTIEGTAAAVNDISMNVLLSSSVPSGKKSIGSMTFFQENLDNNQIQDVVSLRTNLQILDMKSFEKKSIISDIHLDFSGS